MAEVPTRHTDHIILFILRLYPPNVKSVGLSSTLLQNIGKPLDFKCRAAGPGGKVTGLGAECPR
jgi:hypothetical protein